MTFQLGRRNPPIKLVEGIASAQLYWYYGGTTRNGYIAVTDPPCSGWGSALIINIPGDDQRVKLFAPWTLRSWIVAKDCAELKSAYGPMVDPNSVITGLTERLPVYYAAHKLRGWDSDFITAQEVLEALGSSAPLEETWLTLAPQAWKSSAAPSDYANNPDGAIGNMSRMPRGKFKRNVGGKAPATIEGGGLKKPVKRTGRKGEVLTFFLEQGGSGSAKAAEDKFGISRSNLLSQLFLLRKDHGIGYTADGDKVTIQLPVGVEDPFAS